MLSTKLFNIRLYLEGLKRLKVIGMAVAILSVTISALIPIVYWLDLPNEPSLEVIEQNVICIPLYGVIFLSPLFFVVLFSFLHKRKESDFFHAIPYTRTCVYLSFVASALTFIFAIMIASATVAGLIWALDPFTTFKLGELIAVTLMCMLAAAELSAIMMLALSLTGTPTTTFLMFALFTLFTRLIMFYMASCIEDNMSIISTGDVPFFNFSWFLPFGMFSFAINGGRYVQFNPMDSTANVIYTIVVTLLLFAAAWFFYKIRKSEMAGNTAPNRVAQHIFRILFTLPFVLLIPLFMIIDEPEFTLFLVLSVISLLVYYLYELITTKRFKGFGRATALLPVLVACCLAFAGVYTCIENAIFETSPDDPDEVVAINLDAAYASDWDEYQRFLLQDSSSEDRELIEKVVANMTLTVKGDRIDNYRPYFGDGSRTWFNVKFTMKNGTTISRRVIFKENEITGLRRKYISTVQIDEEVFWTLPDVNDITYMYGDMFSYNNERYIDLSGTDKDLKDFYKILLREYNALSIEEKERIRNVNDIGQKGDFFMMYINGKFPNGESLSNGRGRYFNINLLVSQNLMPDTYKYLMMYSRSYDY